MQGTNHEISPNSSAYLSVMTPGTSVNLNSKYNTSGANSALTPA